MSEITKSLVKFQKTAPIVVKNKHVNAGAKQYRYADLAEVIGTIRGALADAGLAFSQSIENNGSVTLVTRLYHGDSGESIESRMPLPIEQLQPQAVGSLLSYYRRYSLTSLLGVVIDDDDDDGQKAQDDGASHKAKLTKQLKESIASEREDAGHADHLAAPRYANDPAYTPYLKETPNGKCWKVTAIKDGNGKGVSGIRDFVRDLESQYDVDELKRFLADSAVLLDACAIALPTWYYGKPGSDVPGIEKRISDVRARLANAAAADDPARYLKA